MADEETTPAADAAGKSEYRVLRKLAPEEIVGDDAEADIYVLLPDTYTGNVKRAVFEQVGEGDYIKVSARSLDPFSARKKEVVTFK